MWPSCPSDGWVGGVDRLTSLPNGKKLVPKNNGALVNNGMARMALPSSGSTTAAASNCTFIPSLDFDQGTSWLDSGVSGQVGYSLSLYCSCCSLGKVGNMPNCRTGCCIVVVVCVWR